MEFWINEAFNSNTLSRLGAPSLGKTKFDAHNSIISTDCFILFQNNWKNINNLLVEMLIENIGRQINLYFKMWNCFFDYTPHSIWGKKLTCAGAKSEHLPNSHKKYFHIKK